VHFGSEFAAGQRYGKEKRMKRSLLMTLAVFTLLVLTASAAQAQSGHFIGTPTCTDEGTFLECTGKVAGLGGTTFRIDVSASGVADVTCTNPAGNVAPGQSFSFAGAGSTGDQPTTTNGQFQFSVETISPTAPARSCPNPKWTATVTDVAFGDATLTLFENGDISDMITVPVS
jgi:hypothetical protein